MIRAIRASLEILGLASDDQDGSLVAVAVLLAATYRAMIRWADFCIQFYGATGSFENFCGGSGAATFRRRDELGELPGELGVRYAARDRRDSHQIGDGVMVVDDLVFRGTSQDISRKNHQAQEIFPVYRQPCGPKSIEL